MCLKTSFEKGGKAGWIRLHDEPWPGFRKRGGKNSKNGQKETKRKVLQRTRAQLYSVWASSGQMATEITAGCRVVRYYKYVFFTSFFHSSHDLWILEWGTKYLCLGPVAQRRITGWSKPPVARFHIVWEKGALVRNESDGQRRGLAADGCRGKASKGSWKEG